MDVLRLILTVYLAIGGAYWLTMLYSMAQAIRHVPRLDRLVLPPPGAWPTVSIVMPACNEERDIVHAARSLLGLDYPNLEIILIDDRSTDRTGTLMDELAAREPRLKVIHIRSLPDGWLGKVHALYQGTLRAAGQWLLFTDGDVSFEPDALRRTMSYALAHGLDHLAAFPGLLHSSMIVDALIISFLRQLTLAMRLWKVNDPGSRAFMGVGAFNLVRRAALDKTEGMEWLRLEVADDAGLGMMLRRSGARQGLVNAGRYLSLHWYRTIGQMAAGAERGFASVGKCKPLRTTLTPLLILALELSMFLALAPLGLPYVQYAAAGFLAAFVAVSYASSRWSGTRFLPSLLAPPAAIISAVLGVRAGILGYRRGGVHWRGTLYTSDTLKAGSRLGL